jgi:hypothetical protein
MSRYLSAGAPTACFNPSCRTPFEGSCVRGDDNHFYCSAACAQVKPEIDIGELEAHRQKRAMRYASHLIIASRSSPT